MAAVAALLIGVVPHVPGIASAIAGRLGSRDSAPPAAARELALAAAALRGEAAAPTVEDAAVLSATCWPAAAAVELDRLAAATLGPRRSGSDPRSRERRRDARIVAHVVTAAEEALYRPILVRLRRSASSDQAALAVLTAAASWSAPELALLGVAVTLTGQDAGNALPPATRPATPCCASRSTRRAARRWSWPSSATATCAAQGGAPCAVPRVIAARPPSRPSRSG